MPKIYQKKCKYCGKSYKGQGKNFCSWSCRSLAYRHPEAIKRKISEACKKIIHTKEWNEKLSLAKKGILKSEETKKKISEALKGKPSGMLGKHHSEKAKKKMSESQKAKGLIREKAPSWKGGKWKDKDGYIHIYNPNHPFAQKKGYIAEHRLVIEKFLGRYLEPWEQVHHINGIKDDNRLENLELVIRKKHFGQRIFPKCLYEFLVK